ncbi:MAG: TRAP transporter large permease subunit [Rhodospirillaceae bacterium]|nr:TRAP transporter large permease subunit [Rhodospirillaceae bacterium]MCY4065393.1 TRAP transporter large permease subunit [Rhodospirillaceae bacterium]MDE0702534.1 TRAP transporter large permease subunit [Rhodospirillaceae bacterium]
MSGGLIAALMFPALFLFIFLGMPVSFSLAAVALLFGIGTFGEAIGSIFFDRLLGISTASMLAAVPLFIFMGAMLERSAIAERLFRVMQIWLGFLPGGLAIATIAMSAVFAAATGIIGAVEAVIGMMAIPAMMKLGYDKGLISGTICAGGSLGTIIPPSIVVIIYASLAELSIGELFAGIIVPGGLMVLLFILYIYVRAAFRPQDAPRVPPEAIALPLREKLVITVTGLAPAVVLVAAVLGAILAGIASPTEAAAVGSVGAILLTLAYREFSFDLLRASLRKTLTVTAMVMMIVVGGNMFSSVFIVIGGSTLVGGLVDDLQLSPAQMVALFLFIVFLLGFVLDWITVVLICLPIFLPQLKAAGVDGIWFAVMVVIVIQTAYLTPPMAPAVFYLRTIAPPEMTYRDMYRGVAPFVVLEAIVLLIVALVPEAATYLPKVLVGF